MVYEGVVLLGGMSGVGGGWDLMVLLDRTGLVAWETGVGSCN